MPSRYGPTLTKIACSCLSKGIRAGDVLPAAVRARRTRLRTESGIGDNNSKSVTLIATDKKTVSFVNDRQTGRCFPIVYTVHW